MAPGAYQRLTQQAHFHLDTLVRAIPPDGPLTLPQGLISDLDEFERLAAAARSDDGADPDGPPSAMSLPASVDAHVIESAT